MKRRFLGMPAREYVIRRLSDGRTLAAMWRQVLDLHAGVVWTYLPETVPDAVAEDPEHEDLARPSVPPEYTQTRSEDDDRAEILRAPSRAPVHRLIDTFLHSSPDAYCVVDDRMLNPSEARADRDRGIPFFFYEEDVYLYLASAQVDEAKTRIPTMLHLVPSWLILGALTLVPGGDRFILPGSEVRRDQLEAAARGTQHIIVGAYDGDGYVIWSRAS
jgi:hypothetical protein